MKYEPIPVQKEVDAEFFDAVMEDFRETLQIRSHGTWKTYRNGIRLFLDYWGKQGAHPDEQMIFNWTEELKAEGKAPSTINNYLASLRAYFRYLEKRGLYRDITKDIKNLKTEEFVRDYFSEDQLYRILYSFDTNFLDGLRNFCMIGLMASTGLRSVSISRANIEDLGSVHGKPVLFYQGKGRQDRNEYVVIPDDLAEMIGSYLARRGVTDPHDSQYRGVPLFVTAANRGSHRIAERNIRSMFKAHCERIGIKFTKNLTTHSLRASFIIHGFKAGIPMDHLREVAGHKSIEQTAHYARAASREDNQAEQTVWNKIFGKEQREEKSRQT